MNNKFLFIIFFILGIIIYYCINNDIYEGYENAINLLIRANGQRENRGCLEYECKNSDYDYNFFERKINDETYNFNNCLNLRDSSTLNGLDGLNVECNNEICCEDLTCKSKGRDLNLCSDEQIFIGSNICSSDGCTSQHCCVPKVSDDSDTTHLLEDIISFRNEKGGNVDNGDKITGLDIRNYLYYNILKFKEDTESEESVEYIDFSNENEEFRYLSNYDKAQFNYTELDDVSKWLSTIDIKIPSELEKVKINVNEDYQFSTYYLNDMFNTGSFVSQKFENTLQKIEGIAGSSQKGKLRLLIILLDRPVGLYGLKPIDVLLHSFKDENKNVLIDKNIFNEIL